MKTLEQIEQRANELGCRCLRQEPMALHTTFRIGGPADLFLTVENLRQLREMAAACREQEIPMMFLGNGSNLLVSDKGIRGVVIRLAGDFAKVAREGKTGICCGAGATLASACVFARDNDLTGLEFAWGIPGSAGGAAYMNAGAYGGEMKDVLRSCEHMTPDGKIEILSGEEMRLSYRRSAYTGGENVILFLHMQLEKGHHSAIASQMEELMNRRREKQPYDMPSAGSVFKRPEGYFAGKLIMDAGLRGFSVGGAQVSEKHCGFVINRDNATAQEILDLCRIVQDKVFASSGVCLETEIKMLGFEENQERK